MWLNIKVQGSLLAAFKVHDKRNNKWFPFHSVTSLKTIGEGHRKIIGGSDYDFAWIQIGVQQIYFSTFDDGIFFSSLEKHDLVCL